MAAAIPERVVSGCRGWPSRRRTGGGLVRILCFQTTIARSKEQKENSQRKLSAAKLDNLQNGDKIEEESSKNSEKQSGQKAEMRQNSFLSNTVML